MRRYGRGGGYSTEITRDMTYGILEGYTTTFILCIYSLPPVWGMQTERQDQTPVGYMLYGNQTRA
jgi:hypothetical protein